MLKNSFLNWKLVLYFILFWPLWECNSLKCNKSVQFSQYMQYVPGDIVRIVVWVSTLNNKYGTKSTLPIESEVNIFREQPLWNQVINLHFVYSKMPRYQGYLTIGGGTQWLKVWEPLVYGYRRWCHGHNKNSCEINFNKERQMVQWPFAGSGYVITSCHLNVYFISPQNGPLFPSELRMSSSGPKLMPQICPSNPDLVAYICNFDIWVSHAVSGKGINTIE